MSSEISAVFQNTLSQNKLDREKSEQFLSQISMNTDTLQTFFTYIINKSENINLRVAACAFLKNYIADYFYDSSYKAILNKDKIMDENSKKYFKENILELMLNSENELLPNIIEMIKIIVQGANGYLIIWPKLMDFIGEILNKHISPKSLHIYNLITKIIKRYHIESKSDPLFREIIYTMDKICKPMTDDAINIIKYFNTYNNTDNKDIMMQCLQMMNKIMSIFYSLNYQDFPEFFEDHLTEWITILNDTLLLPNKTGDINNNIDPVIYELILKVKAKTLKNINLYYSNYIKDNYSKLMKELLDFFKSGFQMGKINNLNMEQLNQIFEYIILPNLSMSQQEIEDFQENPVEFLKIEFEEYDMNSNKYYSINLLQIIINNFPDVNKIIIAPKIVKFLEEYKTDKNKNWNKKLLAINLLFASCIKTFAQKFGVTELNPQSIYNDIDGLITEIFINEFQDYNSPIIVQVYSLKFLSTFRLQITDKNKLGQIILLLINILNKCGDITKNACLLCLDLIINIKDLQTRISRTVDIINNNDIFNNLIGSLLNFISQNTNIFAMRCFFRALKLTQDEKLQQLADSINTSMDSILKLIIKNPQSDEFNFYFFETCALIMKKFEIKNNNNISDLSLIKNFENTLRNDLNLILQNNITDLLGYSFQLFAFYLFLTNDNSDFYQNILNNILTNDKMWDINMKYLYPPSIDYIKVILITNKQFCENKQIIDLLFKICQNLINNKSFNHAFQLIEYLINFVSTDLYGENLTQFLKIVNNIAEQNMTTNPRVYSEINQEMILIMAKLSLKINLNLAMEIVKILSPNNPIDYLIKMIDEIPNFKAIKNKKMLIYFYSQILVSFNQSINDQSLVNMTFKLLNVVKNFYGINFRRYYGFNKNEEDMSYAANNYNKLSCANIQYQIETYKTAEECDENKLFFQAETIVRQNKNIDYISAALKMMKGKELDRMKSFIQNNEYSIQ